jgi:hypothetical protein
MTCLLLPKRTRQEARRQAISEAAWKMVLASRRREEVSDGE